MLLLRNHQISLEKWREVSAISPYSSAFQTPGFYELCNGVPGISAEAFALEEDNTIKALCVVTLQKELGIKGYFSRRAIIYGGPVLKENVCEDTLEYLLTSLSNEFNRRSIYLEIRNLNNYSVFKEVFKRNNWHYIPYQNFMVDCSDKEKLFHKLSNNRKRQIKKAVNSGVIIKEAENISEIIEFYSILQKLYNQKIRKPLFPKEFFEEIFNKGFGKYFLVTYKDKIIGGIICPILEGRCIYEFYVCGLDDEYKEQYPSTMATWAAMEYANGNHIPVFDFMGAGRNNLDYGVKEFKSRFGGELVEYGRYIKINNPFLYKTGEITLKLMKLLKK
jgi:lipid II:glycine glycyltransferase (peptidoglycan interpeptide bridge formation enzyme)